MIDSEANPRHAIPVIDLGRMTYAKAYRVQSEHLDRVVASRGTLRPARGVILLVEHEAVITVTRRAGAAGHVLASAEALRSAGVDVSETDRGGDVTYHGPGQLVAYPIIDLNAHGLRIVDYVRLLESAIIDALAGFGVRGVTEAGATGVWVEEGRCRLITPSVRLAEPRLTPPPHAGEGGGAGVGARSDESVAAREMESRLAKIAAMGVRVRRWVSMHGLSINVRPSMEHFGLIVPCGLHGRAVTSLERVLGADCPGMEAVKAGVVSALRRRLDAAAWAG